MTTLNNKSDIKKQTGFEAKALGTANGYRAVTVVIPSTILFPFFIMLYVSHKLKKTPIFASKLTHQKVLQRYPRLGPVNVSHLH